MKNKFRAALVTVLLPLGCMQQTGGGDDVTTCGYLYFEDGSPAPGCAVSLIPANSQPGSGSGQTYSATTDAKGKYGFSGVSPGDYNIFGKKGGLASYRKDVAVDSTDVPALLPGDTLKPAGGIRGIVRLAGGGDCRTVLIMVIGGEMIRWPEDTAGAFLLDGLAEGNYRIRFLSTLQYPVLDTAFDVFSGTIKDIGTIEIKPFQER